jgi:single-stranded-DNA-specific exonuclease
MEIKNLKKIADRIQKAIKNQEKIILYGDADLDGVSSVIVLEEAIKNLGGKITVIYFPDRETEGYGITEAGLNQLKDFSPALIIALDLGIGNFKGIELAKKNGFKVIVIDHHEILDKLPKAEIIVDPKQKGDKYPFKGLSTAGIIFKLSEILLENKLTENLRNNFLELTALATIADMMPRQSDNEIFIREGLFSLEKSWRPGIKIFLDSERFKSYPNLAQKVSKIISVLNVRDIDNNFPASFRILTSSSLKEAKEIFEKLIQKSELRKEKINIILEEIEKRIGDKENPLIFEGDTDFDYTLISPVASLLCQKYQKPVFIYKKLKKESQGTVRTPSGINSVVLMKKCSKNLLTYGGHPLASGFRIKNEYLEEFKNCLIKNLCVK